MEHEKQNHQNGEHADDHPKEEKVQHDNHQQQNGQGKIHQDVIVQETKTNDQQHRQMQSSKTSTRPAEIITIESYDESGKGVNSFINSPRSVQACEANGIKITDLFIKTKEDVQKLFKGKANLTEEAIQQFQTTIEQKRQQKVDVVKKTRQHMIEQKKRQERMLSFNGSDVYIRKNNSEVFTNTGFKNNWRTQKSEFESPAKTQVTQKSHQDANNSSDTRIYQNGSSKNLDDSNHHFSSYQQGSMQHQIQRMKEKSEKNIEKTRERQKKDILQIIQSEVEARKMRRINQIKEQKMQENLFEQKRHLELKKLEYEENWQKKQNFRTQKEQEQLEKMQTNLILQEHIEMVRLENDRQRKQKLAEESRQREEQRKKNQEQAIQQINNSQKQHEQKIIKKMERDESKEIQIRRKHEEENQYRKAASEQKEQKQRQRVEKNNSAFQQKMNQREEEYFYKQEVIQNKLGDMMHQQQQKVGNQRIKSEQKQKQIFDRNVEQEVQVQQRNEQINQRQYQHEERYQHKLHEKVQSVQEKGQKQREKEQDILQNKEQIEQEQYEQLHKKFLETQSKLDATNRKKEDLLKSKVQRNQSAHFIRRYQAVDNKHRLDQMQVFNNIQLQNRLLYNQQRIKNHELEKMMFMQQVQMIERQNEKEVADMKEKMERKFHRAQDINIKQLANEFNLNIDDLPKELLNEDEYQIHGNNSQFSQSHTNSMFKPNSSRQTTSHAQRKQISQDHKIYSQTPQGRFANPSSNKPLYCAFCKEPHEITTGNGNCKGKNQQQEGQPHIEQHANLQQPNESNQNDHQQNHLAGTNEHQQQDHVQPQQQHQNNAHVTEQK